MFQVLTFIFCIENDLSLVADVMIFSWAIKSVINTGSHHERILKHEYFQLQN